MTPTRRELLGLGAGVIVGVAGCTDDSSEDGGDGTGAATRVAVRSHPEYGDILVDGNGRTVYVFENDEQGAGESACTGGCTDTWPALTAADGVEAGDGVTAELSTFQRADGGRQVTADGWPLYRYADDDEPGDANGQGVGGTWWVVAPDGAPIRPASTPTPTESGGGGSDDGDDGGGVY